MPVLQFFYKNLRLLHEGAAPTRPLVASFLVCFVVSGFFWAGKRPRQPIAFDHNKHVENGVACTDCHSGAEEAAHATLPSVSTCMTCHESALTTSQEEAKVRAAASTGKELVWTQITSVPPHVYFSHRRHVRAGQLDCATCHGAIQKATKPPTVRFRRLDMSDCLNCHRQHGMKTDCNDCHR
jgi:hypothetical protein